MTQAIQVQQEALAANAAATIQVKAGMQSAAGGAADFGKGILQASYAIDDLQYGLSAVVNNIPQMVLGFGGSAGVAGALGVAAVAGNLLVNNSTVTDSY